MKNKRVIGVITVLNDWAVQSFNFNHYLPLGRPLTLIQNLDRWGADEILINCIDRAFKGPNIKLLEGISTFGITTPIIYGGGIQTKHDAIKAIGAGADRISIDSGWNFVPNEVSKIYESVGAQAVIASIPLTYKNEKLKAFNYVTKTLNPLPKSILNAIENNFISEIIIVDYQAEGTKKSFNSLLLELFPTTLPQLITFGGVRTPKIAHSLMSHDRCVAVGIGNYLSYEEHAIQKFKIALAKFGVRPPQYYPYKVEQPIHAPDL